MVSEKQTKKFGSFSGVFVPTFLTIIGVIFYLRLGFIVGSVGLLGTIAIILLSVSVTLATALTISSIVTNTKITEGGPYSIISKTLGREMGGALGIPLFLALAFSVVFYILGFVEGWLYIFPTHSKTIVLLSTFIILFFLTIISTKIAVKTQILVFSVIILSLISIFISKTLWFSNPLSVPLFISIESHSFWNLFALFFPAVTGILAGIGLSGELKDAKTQIPKGIISAVIITSLLYIFLAIWFSFVSNPEELTSNTYALINLSRFGYLILAGLLAATFSSALATLVATPRILNALGKDSVIPLSSFFSSLTKKGEPRNAIITTSALILAFLLIGTLNGIAQILTIFFLITYTTLNLSLLIQQSIETTTFRPTFKIPKIVTIYGALSSIIILLLINLLVGIVAILAVIGIYHLLSRKKLNPKKGDIRYNLFLTISNWFAKQAPKYEKTAKYSWQPHILLPLIEKETLIKNLPILKSMIKPNGKITVLDTKPNKERTRELISLTKQHSSKEIFISYSAMPSKTYSSAIETFLESTKGQSSLPNIIFLDFNETKTLSEILKIAERNELGTIILNQRTKKPDVKKSKSEINLFISNDSINFKIDKDRDFDLGALIGFNISRNLKSKMNIWMKTPKSKEKDSQIYLKKMIEKSRLSNAETFLYDENIFKLIEKISKKGINILSINQKNQSLISKIPKSDKNLFIFMIDSGKENIFA